MLQREYAPRKKKRKKYEPIENPYDEDDEHEDKQKSSHKQIRYTEQDEKVLLETIVCDDLVPIIKEYIGNNKKQTFHC
jgi:hypothetical protein